MRDKTKHQFISSSHDVKIALHVLEIENGAVPEHVSHIYIYIPKHMFGNLCPRPGPRGVGEVLLYFHTYVGSGHFFFLGGGGKNFEFQYFWGFSEN